MQRVITPPAWARGLVSDRTDMLYNPQPLPGEPLEFKLPDDAYFEYAFLDAEGKMRPDPDNERRAENPWYPRASALVGPNYRPDPLSLPAPALETGVSDRLRRVSPALGGQVRHAVVYTPAGLATAELPLVIVQDGQAFRRLARLHLVHEALVERGEARAARFLFVEPVERSAEYAFNADYRAFLKDELLPYVADHYPLSGEHIWLGASLGGLLSATMAIIYPELVDTLVTFSGAFLGTPDVNDYYGARRSWLIERLQAGEVPPRRWHLTVGTFEWLLDVNRRAASELEELGANYQLRERNAGHNWVNWRDGAADALRYALPPLPGREEQGRG